MVRGATAALIRIRDERWGDMSRTVVAPSDLFERERNHVSDARAAFRSAAGSGCLGEIDGQWYLRVLGEYERHVRDSLESRGAGMSQPAADSATVAAS